MLRPARWAVVVVLMLAGCATPGIVEAFCPPTIPAPMNDPAAYVAAIITSLTVAQQADARIASNASFADMLLGLKAAREDYRCARTRVSPFAPSPDRFIRDSADMFLNIYAGLIVLNDKMNKEVVALLDQSSSQGLGTFLDTITTLRTKSDELRKSLYVASLGSTYPLVKFTEQGDSTGSLRLTERQRQGLMRQLEKAFGSVARTGPKSGEREMDIYDASAHFLYKFVADSTWKSSE